MDKNVFITNCKNYLDSVVALKRVSKTQRDKKLKVDFMLHYKHGVENIIMFFNIHNPEKMEAKNLNDILDYLHHFDECDRNERRFIKL